MFLLFSVAQALQGSIKHESNGVVVSYSWGKVCINMCEEDCYDCLDWNKGEANDAEDPRFEYDELWLENNNGTSTSIRFPLRHGKDTKKHFSPRNETARPVVHQKHPKFGGRRVVEPEANGDWYCCDCEVKCKRNSGETKSDRRCTAAC